LVEKWIPPTRSETTKIGQKSRKNFRGENIVETILFFKKHFWVSNQGNKGTCGVKNLI
jgi:hypothetical protein